MSWLMKLIHSGPAKRRHHSSRKLDWQRLSADTTESTADGLCCGTAIRVRAPLAAQTNSVATWKDKKTKKQKTKKQKKQSQDGDDEEEEEIVPSGEALPPSVDEGEAQAPRCPRTRTGLLLQGSHTFWLDLVAHHVSAYLVLADVYALQDVCQLSREALRVEQLWRGIAAGLGAAVPTLDRLYAQAVLQAPQRRARSPPGEMEPAALVTVEPRQRALERMRAQVRRGVSSPSYRFHTPTMEELTSGSRGQLSFPPSALHTPSEKDAAAHDTAPLSPLLDLSQSEADRLEEQEGLEQLQLCAATATRSVFAQMPALPWRRYAVWLHQHRVEHFLEQVVQPVETEARCCAAAGRPADAAVKLTEAIHLLYQGGCPLPEHAACLARLAAQRAALQPDGRAALADTLLVELFDRSPRTVAAAAAQLERHGRRYPHFHSWLEAVDTAYVTPAPLAALVALREGQHVADGSASFVAQVLLYLEAATVLWHPQALLRCAAESAAVAPQRLVVRALQALAAGTPGAREEAATHADLAVHLSPVALRQRAEAEAAAWVSAVVLAPTVSLTEVVAALQRRRGSDPTPDGATLALAYYVLSLTCVAESSSSTAAVCDTCCLVLAPTVRLQATALTRLAQDYAAGAPCHAPELPHNTTGAYVAVRLLHIAVALDSAYSPACVALAQLYREDRRTAPVAHTLTTRYIRYCEAAGAPSYVPAAVLVERSRCQRPDAPADMAEVARRDPRCAFPYHVRAAHAMDGGRLEEADRELQQLGALSLRATDVAMRIRFFRDAAADVLAKGAPRVSAQLRAKGAALAGLLLALEAEQATAAAVPVTYSTEEAEQLLSFMQCL